MLTLQTASYARSVDAVADLVVAAGPHGYSAVFNMTD